MWQSGLHFLDLSLIFDNSNAFAKSICQLVELIFAHPKCKDDKTSDKLYNLPVSTTFNGRCGTHTRGTSQPNEPAI